MGGVFKGHSVHFMLFLTISEAWFKDVGYTEPIQRETLIGEVMTMLHFDWAVLDWIQAHLASGFGDMVMPLITRLGDGGICWACLSGALLLHPKTRRVGAAVAVGLAIEVVCCNFLLKPLIGRIRPCDINLSVTLLIPRPMDFSFPSGHTGAAFAAVAALGTSGSRLWAPALALASLIAFSRLYLYVHYPTDVLAGILLGLLSGWVGQRLVQAVWKRQHTR